MPEVSVIYVIYYDEYSHTNKRWIHRKEYYNSAYGLISFKNYVINNSNKYLFKRIEEIIVRTYLSGYMEIIR